MSDPATEGRVGRDPRAFADPREGQEAAWLAAIVESSEDAIISKTLDGVITSWNEAAQHLYGFAPDEVLGQPIKIIIPEERWPEEQDILARIARGERVAHFETERRKKDGTLVLVSLSVSPVKDAGGRIIGASKIARDVTERKRAEEELRRAAAELARSNSDLQQFAYVASHDLQEPLRAVAGCVDLLRKLYRGKLDGRADELINHAVDGASRMQNLIQDLLAYSRVETRARPFGVVDLGRVLGAVVQNLEVSLRETGARVTWDPLPGVRADESQLVQLLQNLIGNALKFRSERPLEVHVRVEDRGREWAVSVRDNGIGIEPQYFERIFELFQRLHAQRKYPGTGIGLAIAKRIVERHGGRIWVESGGGNGSTFYFTLPKNP